MRYVHRGCVVRPGNDLMAAVAWVAQGWEPPGFCHVAENEKGH